MLQAPARSPPAQWLARGLGEQALPGTQRASSPSRALLTLGTCPLTSPPGTAGHLCSGCGLGPREPAWERRSCRPTHGSTPMGLGAPCGRGGQEPGAPSCVSDSRPPVRVSGRFQTGLPWRRVRDSTAGGPGEEGAAWGAGELSARQGVPAPPEVTWGCPAPGGGCTGTPAASFLHPRSSRSGC